MQTHSSTRSHAQRANEGSRFFTHTRLDRRLEILARQPETFEQTARMLCARLDALGLDLEITDPATWRGAADSTQVGVDSQFNAEIERIRTMGRDEELRLSLRIEFARLRLACALEQDGLSAACAEDAPDLPPRARRRRLEWHALRIEMVERNLYLVLINVARYRHIRGERSDLIQAASAAMFRAVDGFDWRRGLLFRTYAVHWLNQGFRSYLYDFNNTVRVPAYLQKSIKHVNAAIQRLGDPFASVDEIMRESGMRRGIVNSARTVGRRMRSLDAPLDNLGGSRTLASELALPNDEGPYSNALEDVSIESGVETALEKLSGRERRVVELRFGIGTMRAHVYSEIAEEFGVSLERVRQILMRALAKMRTPGMRRMLEPLIN